MLLTCTKDVDASAETVFACVDEPEHIVKWVGGAVSHAYTTERNPGNPVGHNPEMSSPEMRCRGRAPATAVVQSEQHGNV